MINNNIWLRADGFLTHLSKFIENWRRTEYGNNVIFEWRISIPIELERKLDQFGRECVRKLHATRTHFYEMQLKIIFKYFLWFYCWETQLLLELNLIKMQYDDDNNDFFVFHVLLFFRDTFNIALQ